MEGTDIEKHMTSTKVKAWKQNLQRKCLLTDKNEPTVLAIEVMEVLKSPNAPKGDVISKVRKEADDLFEQWWKTYPATDAFEHRGKSFYGSRGLKQKKEDCRKKFNEILLEGEHSAEDLIKALQRELTLKMDQSVKDNENKIKYMQNTATYLNQRTYENFIHPKEDSSVIKANFSTGAIDI